MVNRLLDQRLLGFLASCLLASMLLVSSDSYTPKVPLTELWTAEDGMRLSTHGVVVDSWIQRNGQVSMRIADLTSGASAKVEPSHGSRVPSSTAPSIGDEIIVVGRFTTRLGMPTIYAEEGGIDVARYSHEVLTVASLTENWILFLNDPLRVRGMLLRDAYGDVHLRDLSTDTKVAVDGTDPDWSEKSPVIVEVHGTLIFDESSARLLLHIAEVAEI